MELAITIKATGGPKTKINYMEFDQFRAQTKTVKASFGEVKCSNMFIKAN
jgi:hypothetical protein